MKKYILALAMSSLIVGCQQEQSAEKAADSKVKDAQTTASKEKATKAPAGGELKAEHKMAYALGAKMADNIIGLNTEYKSLGMDIEKVKQGFMDQLDNQSKLTSEELAQEFQIFQQKIRLAEQQKRQESQAAKTAENKVYLDENLKKGFTQTESGLQYKVVEAAKKGAAKPSATDTVKVHYTGTFTDGRQFDSSVGKNPFEFSLKGGVIQGWLEGVKLMDVGSKYQFVVPPELGYGNSDRGPIPGGSILVFDVELLEIVKPETSGK
ncbi:FKBP-type peptidyl-prolyl cis-trans isomerase [Aliikangiella coralliicola]|uniref:Peptidyl-prolyl cis-trans isomerase n=1 Tax=Aliikangiella coralliicola TaxID=2592383 RepID=A0A545UI63_9GAMM|nr:FKBP-type peptidyl-prolyl cis-trans isomerase [Aliikangiella coralliicola]TQV89152.1 FKBP-type peptidyl-prolyl cis-trans isomerase [Aliikangiella coralliicola]